MTTFLHRRRHSLPWTGTKIGTFDHLPTSFSTRSFWTTPYFNSLYTFIIIHLLYISKSFPTLFGIDNWHSSYILHAKIAEHFHPVSIWVFSCRLAHFTHFLKLWLSAKGGFFSDSSIHFLDLQIPQKIIPKNYPELEIWISISG